MRLMSRSVLTVPVLLASAAFVGGCDLFDELTKPIELPVDLDSPPVDIDVGGPVDEAVTSSCSDPAAASCQGIAALCAAENEDEPCDPVDLPPSFPKEVDVDNDGDNEQAADALPDAVKEAAEIKAAIPVDLGELLAAGGVSSPDQVKDISFDKVLLSWEENSLTFDAPVLDVYVGPQSDELDAAVLIENADFKKVGTIGKNINDEDGFDVGQLAGVADEVELAFIDGGKDTFNDALKSFAFTLVVAAPDGQVLTLKENAGDSTKVDKPTGASKLKLKSTLIYTVDLAEAAGLDD